MKKYVVVLCIAAVHFVVTKMVTMVTFSVVTANADEARVSFIKHFLMMLSKVLYFPVLTMAWYPRRIFPGNFIIINSLLWAMAIYMVFMLLKRWCRPVS